MESRSRPLVLADHRAARCSLFLYVPLVVVVLYAFTKSSTRTWPPQLFTLKWFATAWHNPQIPVALKNSILVGIVATLIALTLGTLASFAMAGHGSSVATRSRSRSSCRSPSPGS